MKKNKILQYVKKIRREYAKQEGHMDGRFKTKVEESKKFKKEKYKKDYGKDSEDY